jgi:DNA modification methylase
VRKGKNKMQKPYYQDSAVTIYHGDCREIVPQLGRFDLLLTDPPYGININKSNRLSVSRGFGGETWDSEVVDEVLLSSLFSISENQIVWGGNYYMLKPSRCFLVWDKQNDGRDFADCEYAWTSLDSVARIFRMRPMNMDGGKVHPTQKPENLIRWCIAQHSISKTILDPFAGSGTTGRAAKDLNKTAVLIEREERYCEIAASRMSQEVLAL